MIYSHRDTILENAMYIAPIIKIDMSNSSQTFMDMGIYRSILHDHTIKQYSNFCNHTNINF